MVLEWDRAMTECSMLCSILLDLTFFMIFPKCTPDASIAVNDHILSGIRSYIHTTSWQEESNLHLILALVECQNQSCILHSYHVNISSQEMIFADCKNGFLVFPSLFQSANSTSYTCKIYLATGQNCQC